MNRHSLIVAVIVLLGACAQVTVETTTLSGGTLVAPVESPTTAAVDAVASEICTDRAWVGIAEPGEFAPEAADLQVPPEVIETAVRSHCPGSFYAPLSRAEVDWCGTGSNFGQNFFLVVEAGVDLGIESFSIVEPGLIAKASNRTVELSDYEIELLTAELQTMSESSRFERDWAEACRSTF